MQSSDWLSPPPRRPSATRNAPPLASAQAYPYHRSLSLQVARYQLVFWEAQVVMAGRVACLYHHSLSLQVARYQLAFWEAQVDLEASSPQAVPSRQAFRAARAVPSHPSRQAQAARTAAAALNLPVCRPLVLVQLTQALVQHC